MPYSTISSWVLVLAKTLDAKGLDSSDMFREVGLEPDRLKQPDVRFPTASVARLRDLAKERSQTSAFGLDVAQHWHATSMHALGYTWMASNREPVPGTDLFDYW